MNYQVHIISSVWVYNFFQTFTRLANLIVIIAFKYLIITKGTTHRLRNEAKLTLPDIIWTLVNFNFSWKPFSNLSSLFFDFFSKKVKIENKWLGVCSLLGLPWIVGLHYFNPLLFCLKYETRNKIITNQQFQIRPVRVWIMDCSRKIHTPRLMGFWKFSWEGGSKTLEIQAEGGWGNLKESSAGVISTDSSRDSNI